MLWNLDQNKEEHRELSTYLQILGKMDMSPHCHVKGNGATLKCPSKDSLSDEDPGTQKAMTEEHSPRRKPFDTTEHGK